MAFMSVPPITDQRWRDVATGKIARPWKLLAVKIMMTRILGLTKADPSPTTVNGCVQEIHSFFVKNAQIAQDDLAAIFG
ncbi:MAG TPA: hypothetical protein VL752_13395 [Acidisoma sp.]|jgi:hypothetical protein|uniref:hypothetical protein n=1 Tax=Acidisoma sp. TaxID=1872115 RepID=UPI002D116221|nr:hypothetical protein [Acidisoma sp.]HTI01935.1 hypothetical protein [Acidisoma sp.]